MTRPYASHVLFHFYSGQSCNVDCSNLLDEMSMVGLMSHIAIIDRIALNRRSMSMKISFMRDHSLPVPRDRKSIPDVFELAFRFINPIVSGNVYRMSCSWEINSIRIDGSTESVRIDLEDLEGRIEVKFSSLYIFAHLPNDECDDVQEL